MFVILRHSSYLHYTHIYINLLTLQDFHSKEEDDGDQFPLQQLSSLIGEEHAMLFPSLVQLVVADSAYLELNNTYKEQTDTCEGVHSDGNKSE